MPSDLHFHAVACDYFASCSDEMLMLFPVRKLFIAVSGIFIFMEIDTFHPTIIRQVIIYV